MSFEFNKGLYVKSAEDEMFRNLQLEQIKEALAKLQKRERQLLDMHFYRSMSIKDIAKQLNMPYSTAYKRIKQALKAMRNNLLL